MTNNNRSKPTLIPATRSIILAAALAAAASATPIPHPSGVHGGPKGPSSDASAWDWDSYRCDLGWIAPGHSPGKPPFAPPGWSNPHKDKNKDKYKEPKEELPAVPEPGSLALMGAGLLALLGFRLRSRSKSA